MNGATKYRPDIRLHEFLDTEPLFDAVKTAVSRLAHQAINGRGAFHMVLAGGNTPLPLYRRLNRLSTDWNAWNIYFGDERCLPYNHPDRNSVLVRDAWLNKSAIPEQQVHVIAAETGAENAAREYAKHVNGVEFDLVLLGLGKDGHTASLFPGMNWGEGRDAASVVAVHGAPKPPPDRVSLSARRLSRARRVFFLVTGESKKDALLHLVNGNGIPAAAVRPEAGIDIYTDLGL